MQQVGIQRTASGEYCIVFIQHNAAFYSFSLFFVSVPCAGHLVSCWAHENLPYRIVFDSSIFVPQEIRRRKDDLERGTQLTTSTWAEFNLEVRELEHGEREHITGVWGSAPSGVQGQSPWSGGRGQAP